MKIVSIMLVALMMLLTAAMAANAEEHAAEAVTGAVAVAEEKVNESAVVAKEEVKEAATKAEEKVNASATEAAEKAAPGFESIFAITGLLAVAFLVLGRRE